MLCVFDFFFRREGGEISSGVGGYSNYLAGARTAPRPGTKWLLVVLMFLAKAELEQSGQAVLFFAGNVRAHIVLQWIGLDPVPTTVLPVTTTSRTNGRLPSKKLSKGEISRLKRPAC